ncbi:HAD family phosphatase [Saccharomonospora sp. NPDC006951]
MTEGRVAAGRCQAAIFDCDGLLIDSSAAWRSAFTAAAASLGYRLSAEQDTALLGASVATGAAKIAAWAPDSRLADTSEVRAVLHSALRAAVETGPTTVLPGVRGVLSVLRGRVPAGVASNAPADVLERMLDSATLSASFDVVVSADSVAEAKPAPDVYLAACAALGADPAFSVAFEDSPAGAEAARAAGMSLVVVTGDDWPCRTPPRWPCTGKPIMYVTSLADAAVPAHVLGATLGGEPA